MSTRTSRSHPLQIAEVMAPGAKGKIGITFCPGKKQPHAVTGAWDRDLGLDLDAIKAWGAATIITLIEPHEMKALGVEALGQEAQARGMGWLHMPITDVSTPDHRFEAAWKSKVSRLIRGIRDGERVLVHCKGGLGRAGTVAALMLVELGVTPPQATQAVRAARPKAIETDEQERFVLSYRSIGVMQG
jgi:ADP-ribosyl-[dinitrogen reductase] hydrolase